MTRPDDIWFRALVALWFIAGAAVCWMWCYVTWLMVRDAWLNRKSALPMYFHKALTLDLSVYRSRGCWWFRVNGYGLHFKDIRVMPVLFSERNGFKRYLKIGAWTFRVLVPVEKVSEPDWAAPLQPLADQRPRSYKYPPGTIPWRPR